MKFLFILLTASSFAMGWGELGHHVVGQTASKLLRHNPLLKRHSQELKKDAEGKAQLEKLEIFLKVFEGRFLQQGFVSNIPDIYWRNLENDIEEDGKLLGDGAHFMNVERIFPKITDKEFFQNKIPLDYEAAKKLAEDVRSEVDFYHEVGSLPWRAQQLTSLYKWSLANYPNKECTELSSVEPHPTQSVLAYAGLLAHMTADASQPYHVTKDFDGFETGQAGIHRFFEDQIVESLQWGLQEKVFKKALYLFRAKAPYASSVAKIHTVARRNYPDMKETDRITALMWALISDSYNYLEEVRAKDELYSIATLGEARRIEACRVLPGYKALDEKYKKASPKAKAALAKTKVKSLVAMLPNEDSEKNLPCRRSPDTWVGKNGLVTKPGEGKKVAKWFEPLVVDRLAIASALTADIWVGMGIEANIPTLCWTWKYVLKPGFISPTSKNCYGYALNENSRNFTKKDGSSALPWKNDPNDESSCLKL